MAKFVKPVILTFGVAGFLYLLGDCKNRRKKEMSHVSKPVPGRDGVEVGGIKYDRANEKCYGAGPQSPDKCVGLTAREEKELVERVKAMTPEELAIVVDNIPVSLCMARINSELARAAEFERRVTEACGMK